MSLAPRPFPISDHFDGKVFFNPTLGLSSGPRLSSVFKMLFKEKRSTWPKENKNLGTPQLNLKLSPHQAALTFVNHATFLIQVGGMNIVTDPVWSNRVSPFTFAGPARFREPGIAFSELPKIDLVLLSHNHYDHLDKKFLSEIAKRDNPTITVALGDGPFIAELGFKNIFELDWWQEAQFNADTKITFAPTQHFSARGLFDRCHSLWGGYVLEVNGHKIFFGGDAGYSTHYHEILKRMGVVDLSIIGIGAYEPSWFMRPMHMNPEEAVQAHIDLKSKQSLGMHYGTFQLSAEGIDQPVKDLKTALTKLQVPQEKFITMNEGETRVFNFET